jgi:hypothetical protein
MPTRPKATVVRHPGNRIGLWRTDRVTFLDHRAVPGGPPQVGQVATLSVRTTHSGPPGVWKYEYVTARVTALEGPKCRGVVFAPVYSPVIPPEQLKAGDELVFDAWDLVALADAPTEPDVRQSDTPDRGDQPNRTDGSNGP